MTGLVQNIYLFIASLWIIVLNLRHPVPIRASPKRWHKLVVSHVENRGYKRASLRRAFLEMKRQLTWTALELRAFNRRVETRPGSQLPSLIKPCVWFSRTRLSDVLHARHAQISSLPLSETYIDHSAYKAIKKLFASAIKTGGNQFYSEGLDKEAFKSAHKINSS